MVTRKSVDFPGGLNGVARGLAEAQSTIGLSSAIVDELPKRISPATQLHRRLYDPAQPDDTLELVEYHFAQTVGLLSRVETLSAIPKVFHFHGPWWKEGTVQGNSWFRALGKRLVERGAYRRFDLFTAHSRAFAAELSGGFGISPDRIITIPAGVDTARLVPGDKQSARAALGLSASNPVFVAVRRLEPRMGLHLAINAIGCLPDSELVVVGQGSAAPALKELADSLGLNARVHFLGRLSEQDRLRALQAADVALVPSIALEGFGLVVLEAMATGTPVVASDSGGLVDAMGPFAHDWCVEANNQEALNERMADALVRPPSPAELRDYALSRSWESTAKQFENAYMSRGIL